MGDKNKVCFMITSHESCLLKLTFTHGFSHSTLTTLSGKYYYDPHFTDEEQVI